MTRHLTALLLASFFACSGADLDWDPASRLSGDEKKAWASFIAGVKALQEEGNRKAAAEFFEQVATRFPESQFADDSKELGTLLRQMLDEEKQWTEPPEPDGLRLDRRIAYYTYHLRDLNCYQISQPGMCYVLQDFAPGRRGTTNAAMKLKALGEPAIPALIQLLEDRRPTRSVGYWRNFAPSRTVLRFQDAAIQILNELLPAGFYGRNSTSAYFSTESPAVRSNIIHSIKSWYHQSVGKTEVEKKWLAVDAGPGIYQLLGLLREIAAEHDQKERVMATLQQMCTQGSPLQLPQISELMCELGDFGKVDAVVSAYIAGKYDVGEGINAQDSALRQAVLYGTVSQRDAIQKNAQRKPDPLQKERALFSMLVDTATERWKKLPKTYDRTRFPIQMLVAALANRAEWSSWSRGTEHGIIRRCDVVAEAIQKITRQGFGFDGEKSENEKDEAIANILDWWKKGAASTPKTE